MKGAVVDVLAVIGGVTLLSLVVLAVLCWFSRGALDRHAESTDPWQRVLNRRRPAVLQQDWN